jgi:hypothetical protein
MAISPENIDWTPVLGAVQTEVKQVAAASFERTSKLKV